MTGAVVGIAVGSDSDLPVMKEAAEVLEELGIGCEVVISSAHRTPEQTAHYARTAAERGLAVIIAAAGMAAHLPGVIAAHTPLPVIGVPVKSGALLAAQIIGAGDPAVRERVARYKARMAEAVLGKARRLAEVGLDAYLKEMGEKGK